MFVSELLMNMYEYKYSYKSFFTHRCFISTVGEKENEKSEDDLYDEDKSLLFRGTFCLKFVKGMFKFVLFMLTGFRVCVCVGGWVGACVYLQ